MKNLICFLLLAAGLLPATTRAQTTPPADWLVACGTNSQPLALTVDAQHNTYVTGTFSGTITLGSTTLSSTQAAPGYNGPQDTFVAKLNDQGQYQWAMQFGDGQVGFAMQVVTDQAGHVFLAGGFRSYSLRIGAGGPVLYNSSNDGEGFVVCLSAQTGQCQWARRFGGTGYDVADLLAVSPTGELYLSGVTGDADATMGPFTLPTGSTSGYYAFRTFLAKLSASGTWLWAQQPTTTRTDAISFGRPIFDGRGNFFVVGGFSSPNVTLGSTTLTTGALSGGSTGSDVFVAKYTEGGVLRWARQANPGGHSAQTVAGSAAYDGQGHLFVVGTFSSRTAQLGPFALTNTGPLVPTLSPTPNTDRYYTDAFAARLDTAGTWQWATPRGSAGAYDYGHATALDAAGQPWLCFRREGSYTLTSANPVTGAWGTSYALPEAVISSFPSLQLTNDQFGRLYLSSIFTGSSMTLGTQTIPGAGSTPTGYIARLGQQVLATHPTPPGASTGLHAWPSPGPGSGVWVQGAPAGQPVQVLDVLGRQVGAGTMPASGPLRLHWAGAGLAPGVYIIRAGQLGTRWVVEN